MPYQESKLSELVLYIVQKSEGDRRLGKTKLLKLLAYSDFEAYRRLGASITGATYRKLPYGPAPRQAPEVLEILCAQNKLTERRVDVFHLKQWRYEALQGADLSVFSADQLELVDEVVARFRAHTNKQMADASHRDFVGWELVDELDEIPYRTALLSDDEATAESLAKGREALERLHLSA